MEKEPKKTKKAHHPDDLFFKKVMERKTSVVAYLESFAPEIEAKLDLTTLQESNESFVDETLDLFQSDIVYRCQLKNSKESLYLSFIWEHKSSPEQYVALQIGLYLSLAMYKMSKQKGRKLEIILPFLFYNGSTNWQPKTIHDLFKKVPQFDTFKKHVPQFQFVFTNVVRLNDLELLAIKDAFFRSAMFAMASRNDVNLIIKRAIHILSDEEGTRVILSYILHFAKKDYEAFRAAIIESENPLKNKIMSTMEQLEQHYIEIGEERGIEKGVKIGEERAKQKAEAELKNTIFKLHKNGFDVKEISYLLNRTEDYVEIVILEKGLETQKNKEKRED